MTRDYSLFRSACRPQGIRPMNKKFTQLATAMLAAGAWLCLSAGAQAAIVAANFQTNAQTFSATVTGSGNLIADGNGVAPVKATVEPFVLTPPLDHPLELLDGDGNPGGPSLASNPRSVAIPKIDAPYRFDRTGGDPPKDIYVYYEPSTGDGVDPYSAQKVMKTVDGKLVPVEFTFESGVPSVGPPKVFGFSQTLLDANGQALNDIQNLDLDIFNGKAADFGLSQVIITTNSNNPVLKNIFIDFEGTLKDLTFQQTGGAILSPTGAGMGTFAIDGLISATAGDLKAIVFGALNVDIDDQSLSQEFTLTGTYKIEGSPNDPNAKITLDGNTKFSYVLATITSLETALTEEELIPLTVSAAVSLAASIDFDINFHLERVGVIPEPGSIVLLGVGLASVVPVYLHRRRRLGRS
ncbi:MAG: hypothetical protein AB7U73_22790 [Pirellulales bacterium]